MELVFQENTLDYLGKILCETVVLEQTADLIVPDSLPDGDRVVDSWGTVLVRGEECTGGSASVNGMVQAGVLMVGEKGEVYPLQAQIPFSARKEFPSDRDNCTMQCECTLRSVDARLLNSRKVLVRVGVACAFRVYGKERVTTYDMEEPAPTLQLRRVELPLQMPVDLGEKSFGMNEELELPSDKPALRHLLKCVYKPQVHEQKIVGDKAVFKGNLQIHGLYESEDGKIVNYDWNIPFSQYAELGEEAEDCQLQTILSLTSADTEPEGQFDCRRLFFSGNFLAQCTVLGQKKVTLIEDAFCTDGELAPEWNEWSMYGILDRQLLRDTAVVREEGTDGAVLDVCVYPDTAALRRTEDGMKITIPMSCNMLYQDGEGNLQGRTIRPEISAEIALAEDGSCSVTEIRSSEVFAAINGNGVELRIPVSMTVESYADHRLRCVCGGTITPAETTGRSGVILRRTSREEQVWDIAKACKTSVASIMEINELQQPTVPENIMLLIQM